MVITPSILRVLYSAIQNQILMLRDTRNKRGRWHQPKKGWSDTSWETSLCDGRGSCERGWSECFCDIHAVSGLTETRNDWIFNHNVRIQTTGCRSRYRGSYPGRNTISRLVSCQGGEVLIQKQKLI